MVNITLPDNYGYVMMTSVGIAFECYMTSFIVAGRTRMKIFNSKFLKDNFEEEHKRHFDTPLPMGGLPDSGSGRYAAKLSYPDWVAFNSAQRVHLNFVESLTPVVLFTLVGGVKHPFYTLVFGGIYGFSRFLYTALYINNPNTRLPAVGVNILATLGLFILAISSSLKLARGS